ncbi:MAG: Tetratricopeptide repeat-containing protein [Candidatus Electronema aureum]|uniref:Tetratricopeptide repeat-containing protein n=1 Tax=Candidatus Electronema aureum TaxID=2005002 RepID=A0A521G0G0_9BACT|nr:MAG: Tetratricopeptide repeat-containing protein [Candidatus Electronema aureum]
MTNHFNSSGGEQNVGQGDHAIGKQENVTQTVRGDGNIFSGTGNVTVNGIPPALFAEYAGKLAVTDSALASFFKILEEQQVPHSDLDSKLREIAGQYKELLARVGDNQAAKQAIERGDYAQAEALLEDVARQHSMAAAEAHADNARLQRLQWHHAKAAAYWQKAAALLPEESKRERSLYLHEAAYDLHRVDKYTEALSLYEQSLAIEQEFSDKEGEGIILNNIAEIYLAMGDYDKALPLYEQCRILFHEIGKDEGMMLNNFCLHINIETLRSSQEIGNKVGEAMMSWNVSRAYIKQGDLRQAEAYMSRAVQLAEEISYPLLEEYREALADIRAILRRK